MPKDRQQGRHETSAERADRNWLDLLQELRVSQTGVQLLAGFLVTLPFQAGFAELTVFQRQWYVGLLGLAFVTVGVTLAPVSIHRHLFRDGMKPELVRAAHVLTELALALIAMLLAGIAFLVVDVVLDRIAALTAGGLSLAVLMVLLVGLPRIVARRSPGRS